MLIDSRLRFSNAQAITATADSTSHLDMGTANNIGKGEPMFLVVLLTVAPDNANGNETYEYVLESDDNASFSSATDIVTIAGVAGSPAGHKHVVSVPYSNERYLQMRYTLGGTTPSVTITSFLTNQEPESWEAFPDAI